MWRSPFFVLMLALMASGCFWSTDKPTVTPTKGTTSAAATPSTTADADVAGSGDDDDEHRLANIFSLRNKIDEVRYLYEHGQENYAVRQAEGLLSQLEPNSRERLQLHFLMARCYERLGEDKSRKHHDKAFRDLLEQFGRSKEHQQAQREGAEVRELIERSMKLAEPMQAANAADIEDEMFNVRCERRLQRISKEQVLHENLEPNGHIYYGRTPEEVRKHVAAARGIQADAVVLQRDPRFGFYFAIIEEKP